MVQVPSFARQEDIQSDGRATGHVEQTILLKDYPGQTLPLQNVDEQGVLQQVEDMVDLPFLHEVRLVCVCVCTAHGGEMQRRGDKGRHGVVVYLLSSLSLILTQTLLTHTITTITTTTTTIGCHSVQHQGATRRLQTLHTHR